MNNLDNFKIKYYYNALIIKIMVVAVDLGLFTETDKDRYADEAEVEPKKL